MPIQRHFHSSTVIYEKYVLMILEKCILGDDIYHFNLLWQKIQFVELSFDFIESTLLESLRF